MKPLTLLEIQRYSLDILKSVHTFCVEHNIKYSLAYGTLIGAIRHKGFIPWDDDIDIIMPRPDYNRFCSTFQVEGLGMLSEKDPDYYLNYCRVFDTVNTKCDTLLPISKRYTGGVWIDVFPADGVSDDKDDFVKNIDSIKKVWMLQLRFRHSLISFPRIIQTCGIKDCLILSAIKLSSLGRIFLNHYNEIIRNNAEMIPYGSTAHWSQIVVLDDGVRNYQLCEDFEDTIDTEFEGCSFKIMQGYDRFLRNIYGDYMQLPPEGQRHPKLSHVTLYLK